MPPMTDNQRESAVRSIAAELRARDPKLSYPASVRIAERRIEERKHLRGRFR